MKQLILTLMLILPSLAFADLGDTYAQSCAKYGGPGKVSKTSKSIVWLIPGKNDALIAESFVKNRCVRMTVIPEKGKMFSPSAFDWMRSRQCNSDQTWILLESNEHYVASWATSDNAIAANVYPDGRVQFAYIWWLKEKGLAEPLSEASAPIEDNAETVM